MKGGFLYRNQWLKNLRNFFYPLFLFFLTLPTCRSSQYFNNFEKRIMSDIMLGGLVVLVIAAAVTALLLIKYPTEKMKLISSHKELEVFPITFS